MEIKMPAYEITTEYFLKEYHLFRALMCRADKSVDDKLEGYKALWFVYLNLKLDQPKDKRELCMDAMNALDVELNMRIGLQAFTKLKALIMLETGANNGKG
jgi:hypothetical protein